MKTLYGFFIFIILTGTTMAQPRIHLGITSGFNTTWVLDNGLQSNPNYITQANYNWFPIGGSVGIDITNGIGFQFESISATQGQVYQMMQTVQSVQKMIAERKIDLNYIQLPLLLKLMGTGVKPVRFNFQIGPQLSLLNNGLETIQFYEDASIKLTDYTEIPPENTGEITEITQVLVSNEGDLPQPYLDAINNGDITPGDNPLEVPLKYFEDPNTPGQYDMPQDAIMMLMSSQAENELQKFKDKEVQLAFGFGIDIDVLKHFYISTNIRGNYSFTDMRNQDLIELVNNGEITNIFSNRANLLLGVQIGLHWVIGGNRSFRAKRAALNDDGGVR